MFFVFEVSRPFQLYPYLHKGTISQKPSLRATWLFFALSLNFLRFDEFIALANKGIVYFRYAE